MGTEKYGILKRGGSLLAALVLLAMSGCTQGQPSGQGSEPTSPCSLPNTMTGEELMKELTIGWNLGNTFDAPEGETSWGNPVTTRELLQKGIPVIIDEMGCIDKENPEARYAWAKAYISAAAEYGIPCVWWDNGAINGSGENFGLIDRRKLEVYEDSLSAYQGLMDGLKAQ